MTKFIYSDTYQVSLGEKHRFPMVKYRLLRESLIENAIVCKSQLEESKPIEVEHLYLAHDQEYVDQIINLSLGRKEARKIGLPLTNEMVIRTRASIGASVRASELALEHGVSAALSSGTHHAHYDSGEGYCFFNDFAVISRLNRDKKVLIIDLDVHQGNGNASILNEDKNVLIFDMFCAENYPYRKVETHINIPVPKNSEDSFYLELLNKELKAIDVSSFDLILYQAGVDILSHDHLGLLNISHNGVLERDKIIFHLAKKHGVPISFVIGGGYAKNINETVCAYVNTFKAAKDIFKF